MTFFAFAVLIYSIKYLRFDKLHFLYITETRWILKNDSSNYQIICFDKVHLKSRKLHRYWRSSNTLAHLTHLQDEYIPQAIKFTCFDKWYFQWYLLYSPKLVEYWRLILQTIKIYVLRQITLLNIAKTRWIFKIVQNIYHIDLLLLIYIFNLQWLYKFIWKQFNCKH